MDKNTIKCVSMGFIVCLAGWTTVGALGDQQPGGIDLKEPQFVSLAIGQDMLSGRVKDELKVTELEQISFYGSTDVGGVYSEHDDSITEMQLAHARRLTVKASEFNSLRYPGKELCSVDSENIDGSVTKGLLFPRKIVICGIQRGTYDAKAWFLSKIDYLEIDGSNHHASPLDEPQTAPVVPPAPAPVAPQSQSHAVPATPPAPVAQTTEVFQEKRVVVLEKQNGLIEKKTIFHAFNDVLVSIIGLVKAIFESVRGLFMH